MTTRIEKTMEFDSGVHVFEVMKFGAEISRKKAAMFSLSKHALYKEYSVEQDASYAKIWRCFLLGRERKEDND